MSFRFHNLRKYMMNACVGGLEPDSYWYTVNTSDEATLQRYLNSRKNVITPIVYDEYDVKGIGIFTYQNMDQIQSCFVPEGIEFIL